MLQTALQMATVIMVTESTEGHGKIPRNLVKLSCRHDKQPGHPMQVLFTADFFPSIPWLLKYNHPAWHCSSGYGS